MLWKSLCDYELWPIYAFGLLWEIPVGPPDQYLTLTLRNLGFGTFDANLLSIPAQFTGAVTMCIMTYFSTRLNERALFGMLTQFWYLPNLIAMAVLPADASPWAQFAIVTVLLSYPSRKCASPKEWEDLTDQSCSACHACFVGQSEQQQCSHTRRVTGGLQVSLSASFSADVKSRGTPADAYVVLQHDGSTCSRYLL